MLTFVILLSLSCNKSAPLVTTPGIPSTPASPPPATPVFSCNNRPVINVKLTPIGLLSTGRATLKCGTAGTKILFAGGWAAGAHSSRVDIYDTLTKTWSIAELSEPYRDGMAVATVGKKIFFAGGGDYDWTDISSRVDIYDASANAWSIAELSVARHDLAAVTLGNKIFFAGGAVWGNIRQGSNVVDIYDNGTNTWSTTTLSEGRYELTATAAANKLYFAGGINNMYSISSKIDIFDSQTNTWTISQLKEPKTGHAAIAANNKIFWAGGAKTSYQSGYTASSLVEIKDAVTGLSSLDCITAKTRFDVVAKNDTLVFFTGNNIGTQTQLDIFNTSNSTWSIGLLPFSIRAAAIICVNNTIYVAGGMDNPWGPYFNGVWKLEF